MTIPIHADEVTTSWLEEALGARTGSLNGFSAAPVGTGQVASSFRLNLDWSEEGFPSSLVLKSPSVDETSRKTGADFGLYAKEVGWYQQLAARSDVRCPACHGAFIEGDRFALLLEDCAPAEQGDQLGGATLDDLSKCLLEGAKLHGAFFNDRAMETHPLLAVSSEMAAARSGIFAMFWEPFKERYQGRLGPEIFELGDDFLANYHAFGARASAAVGVAHGDFRIDNMLFGGADGRVVVLDWQTLGYGAPMADVAYLLGTSIADPAVRKREERALVGGYFSNLRDMEISPDEDALWQDYRVLSATGFIMAVTSSMLVVRTERGDELFAVMCERSAWQMMDLEMLSCL